MDTLRAMMRDALKAVLFWAILSVPLVFFLRYTGAVFSGLLALIMVACFCAMWGAQLLFWLLRIAGGGGSSSSSGGGHRQNQNPGSAPRGESSTCPDCQGRGSVTCKQCNGSGWRFDGQRNVTCTVCMGQRFVSCSNLNCAGGRLYT